MSKKLLKFFHLQNIMEIGIRRYVSVVFSLGCFIGFCENSVVGLQGVHLPNEGCRSRPTLIPVGNKEGDFYPVIISLLRCGGSCHDSALPARACTPLSTNTIRVNVFNNLVNKSAVIPFQNHLSCGCKCIYNSSVCGSSQIWDDRFCKCVCIDTAETAKCQQNFTWNPNHCKCECDLTCAEARKFLNKTSCSCTCKPKYYKRCNRKQMLLDENNCTCVDIKPIWNVDECKRLPTKWAAVITLLAFTVFIVISFDLVLFCKNSGLVYSVKKILVKGERAELQRQASMASDARDSVRCIGIKPVDDIKRLI